MSCPASISDGGASRVLNNASLFDGPPDQMADLIPQTEGAAEVWDMSGIDPYLVCRFKGTGKTATIHAVGAKSCEMRGKPFRAYCKT